MSNTRESVFKIAQRLLKFCKSGEILPNLVIALVVNIFEGTELPI